MKLIISVFPYYILLLAAILEQTFSQTLDCVPYKKNKRSVSFFERLFQKPIDYSNYSYKHNTRFYLLTRKNSHCTQELELDNPGILKRSFFNSTWPTRILIHGWKNDLFSKFNELLKDAYLKNGNFNVIIVDWSEIAKDSNYARTASATRKIGEIVANFTKFLYNNKKITFNKTYLIGHSLGAQISGIAGYHIQPKHKFNTIFALDPAEPNFGDNIDLKYKIDSNDADYVESIQTDSQLFGQQIPIGNSSFFPAYGKIQPGCYQIISGCSHSRAYKYLAESINSRIKFWGIRCKNINEIKDKSCTYNGLIAEMGGEPSTHKGGIYYVPVRSEEPYAVGII